MTIIIAPLFLKSLQIEAGLKINRTKNKRKTRDRGRSRANLGGDDEYPNFLGL